MKPTLQHYLNKLISEEVLAFESYKVLNTLFLSNDKFQKTLVSMFDDISEDEYSDHAAKLINYARKFGLEIPRCNADYVKFASQNAVKAFQLIPETDDLSKLLEYAMNLEIDAINSYNEVISRGFKTDEFDIEIMAILQNNLKDEIDHYEKISMAYAAACDVI